MEDNTWFDNAVSLMSAQLIGDKRQDVSGKGSPFDDLNYLLVVNCM